MYIFELNLFWLTISPTYYWLMYVIAFVFSYIFISKWMKISYKKMDDLLLYSFIWVILWWRLAYIIFYDLFYYIENPNNLIKIWEWWMSFHGWAIWVILAMYFFAKKYKLKFLKLADELCRTLPIWLWLWRLWNYINQELLWFSPYNWPLAIYKNSIWYFPSPLLEALLEWIILFLILNYFYKKKKNQENNTSTDSRKINDWQIWALFLIFYAIFRIFVELFFRVPDPQIWYFLGFLTMWTFLTIPMFLVWIYYFFKLNK